MEVRNWPFFQLFPRRFFDFIVHSVGLRFITINLLLVGFFLSFFAMCVLSWWWRSLTPCKATTPRGAPHLEKVFFQVFWAKRIYFGKSPKSQVLGSFFHFFRISTVKEFFSSSPRPIILSVQAASIIWIFSRNFIFLGN